MFQSNKGVLQSHKDPIMAPYLRRGIGRPNKERRKVVEEPKTSEGVRKQYHQLRCRIVDMLVIIPEPAKGHLWEVVDAEVLEAKVVVKAGEWEADVVVKAEVLR